MTTRRDLFGLAAGGVALAVVGAAADVEMTLLPLPAGALDFSEIDALMVRLWSAYRLSPTELIMGEGTYAEVAARVEELYRAA